MILNSYIGRMKAPKPIMNKTSKPSQSFILDSSTFPSQWNSINFGLKKNRKKIFQNRNTSFNLAKSAINSFMISTQKILQNDENLCGCESKISPCQIIELTFLRDARIKEMKQAYSQIADKGSLVPSQQNKNLIQMLPTIYPQIYYPHLNSLMNSTGKDLSWAQFSCLSSIEYHAKMEHFTYFLYQDLKHCFRRKNSFVQRVKDHLFYVGEMLPNIKRKKYQQIFYTFIEAYYESVGANLVPVIYYAKFIKKIYQKGNKILLLLLIRFITNKKVQLEECLDHLKRGQLEVYRSFVKGLDWPKMLQDLDQQFHI